MNDFMFIDAAGSQPMYRALSFETAIKRYVKTLDNPIEWSWIIQGKGDRCCLTVSLLEQPEDVVFMEIGVIKLTKDWRKQFEHPKNPKP